MPPDIRWETLSHLNSGRICFWAFGMLQILISSDPRTALPFCVDFSIGLFTAPQIFFPLERSVEEKQIERKSEGIWDGNQSSCNLGNDIPSHLLHCFYRSPNSRGGDYTWTWVQGGQEHWCHLAIAYPTWHTNVGDRRLSSSCSRPVHISRNWHSPAAK